MTFALDLRTIVFMTFALGLFISASMMYVLWRHKVYPGFYEWTLAYLSGALGMLFLSQNKVLPHYFNTVLGNTLLVVCYVLFGTGLKRFTNTRQRTWLDVSAVAVVAICFFFFTYYAPSMAMRIVVISTVIGLLSLRNTILSIREIPKVLGSANGLLTFIFAAMAVLFLGRAMLSPAQAIQVNDLLDTGTIQAVCILVSALLSAILAMAMIFVNTQRYQRELQVSQNRFRRLVEDIRNDYYLYSHDPAGVFTYLTPSAQDLFGDEYQGIVGRNWREVFDLTPEDEAKGDQVDAECRQGRFPPPFDFTFQFANQNEFTVETQKRPVFDDQGNVIAIEGIAKDITQRKQAEKALRKSEEKYRTLVENVGVGIIIMQDLHFVFANHLVRHNMGLSSEDSLEQADPFSFIHPDDRDMVFARQKARTRNEKVPTAYTFQWLLPNGQAMWLEATDVLIDWNGRPATLNFVTDITERKHMEAERDLLIDELQHALSEVKTLSGLLPICANCKKIRDDSGYWTQVEQYIRIHSQAEFSHSICPDCIKKLYPELTDRIEDEKANGENGI